MISRKKRILIADDEKMVLEVAHAMLTHLGYEVITASSGMMALELYDQHRDEIDLVVLDLSMPDLDGFHCLDKIRENSQVPVLLSSGLSHSISGDEPQVHQAQGILPKPFTLDNLKELMEKTLPD